jgi:tetratricopeptide (TPR) repeat protein
MGLLVKRSFLPQKCHSAPVNYCITYILAVSIICLFGCQESNEQLINDGNLLLNKGNVSGAIKEFSKVIARNKKLQVAYYDRSLCYTDLKEYALALNDLNRICALQGDGPFSFVMNPNSPFATEEDKSQVPTMTVLFERGKVKYLMDSLKSAFIDFQTCLDNNYQINDCRLWIGTIYIKSGDKKKGCDLYQTAKLFGDDEAADLIKGNCK